MEYRNRWYLTSQCLDMGVSETEAYSQFMALCVGKIIIFWGMIPLIFGTTTKSYQNPRLECSGGYWVYLYDHGRPSVFTSNWQFGSSSLHASGFRNHHHIPIWEFHPEQHLYSVWILPILVSIRHDEWGIGSGPRSYHGWEIPELNGGCNGRITGKYGKIEQISL